MSNLPKKQNKFGVLQKYSFIAVMMVTFHNFKKIEFITKNPVSYAPHQSGTYGNHNWKFES